MLNIPFTTESRLDLIKMALNKTQANKYLEIGCDKDKIFSKVVCKHKVGVDPSRGGTHRMTSDEFFQQNLEKFDVIFIDGLHYYEQVTKDFYNSLKCLNEGGIIILHDMLPLTPTDAVVPIPTVKQNWLGDVWRLAFDLSNYEDITFNVVLIDNGCGIAWKEKQVSKNFKPINTWEYYADNWKNLPLLSFNDVSGILK